MSEHVPIPERHQPIWAGTHWVCAACHERLPVEAKYERCAEMVRMRKPAQPGAEASE